jgi:hypothetical protein
MKTFMTLSICGLAAFAASGLWGQVFDGEEEGPSVEVSLEPDKKPQTERRKKNVILRREAGGYGGYGAFPQPPMKVELRFANDQMQAIQEAAKALSEAEDDDDRDEAQEKLSELLDEYFEQDMKRREEELAAVEKRVKQLRALLERRREKKEDIINLQIDVLRNEADGLGFFSGDGGQGPMTPQGFMDHLFRNPGAGLPPGHPHVPGVPATPPAPAAGPVVVPVQRPR